MSEKQREQNLPTASILTVLAALHERYQQLEQQPGSWTFLTHRGCGVLIPLADGAKSKLYGKDKEEMMVFAVDIDGTIAGLIDWTAEGVVPAFLEYAQTIGLALPVQVEAGMSDGRSFLHLPEVIAFRQACPDRWKATLRDFRASPAGMERARVMPGAVQGVRQLAQVGQVSYYTVRQGEQQEVQAITRRWLSTRGFPRSEQVVFCRSVMNKLLRLARHIQITGETVVLIDDLYELLLDHFAQLATGNHPNLDAQECHQIADRLRTHLMFVAFGGDAHVKEQARCDGRVLTLPSWDRIADVLSYFS